MGTSVAAAAIVFLIAAIIASGKLWCMALTTTRDNSQRAELRRDVLKATDDLLSRMK